jgi:hypothetical protein
MDPITPRDPLTDKPTPVNVEPVNEHATEPVQQPITEPISEPVVEHVETVTTTRDSTWERRDRNAWLAPTAIGLGLLLITASIAFLRFNKQKQIATLPEYSPLVIVSPYASSSPISVATPTATPTTTQSPAATPSAGLAVEVVATPTPHVAGTSTTKGGVSSPTKKTTYSTITKSTKSSLPQYTPQTQLPDYQPNSSNSENLPAYTPNSELPAYQPQASSPSPEVQQTIRVTLVVPGKPDYTVYVAPGSTVLSVLKAAQAQGLSFSSQYFASYNSEMVTSINGQAQNGSHFWLYAVNGTFVNKGISLQTVNQYDRIIWSLS